jgi:hypothetical protein
VVYIAHVNGEMKRCLTRIVLFIYMFAFFVNDSLYCGQRTRP